MFSLYKKERPRSALISCAVGLCVLMCAKGLAEDVVFSPEESGWSGLSELKELIAQTSTVVTDTEIKLSALRTSDVLWVVAPTENTPVNSIRAFVADGGTLIVFAEPSGDNDLLERYGISCITQRSDQTWNLRGNRSWPIATANQQHAVTAGVRGVVVNEGCRLEHTDLEPFLVYGGDRAPFAYAGGVKSGRVIMLGDASVLTNGMLRFRGNRSLAENLVRFASRPRHLIAHPKTTWSGFYRDPSELNPASRLENSLETLAKTRLPHGARAALGLTLMLLLALPLLLARSQVQHVIERFSQAPKNRTWRNKKGLRLRLEFEDSLRRQLDLPRPFSAPRAIRAMRERGLSRTILDDAEQLLNQLDQLQRGSSTLKLSNAQLEQMLDTAESILDRISTS